MKQLSYMKVKRITKSATIPTKANPSDSGFDLYAAEDVVIEPGESAVIRTGIALELPEGMEAQVRPRSGVTSKSSLRVQLGTIDNDYRGEIGIILDNTAIPCGVDIDVVKLINGENLSTGTSHDIGSHLIRKGDRIAQLVVQYLPYVDVVEITGDLSESKDGRGDKGFGSSGYSKSTDSPSCNHNNTEIDCSFFPHILKCTDCGEVIDKESV